MANMDASPSDGRVPTRGHWALPD